LLSKLNQDSKFVTFRPKESKENMSKVISRELKLGTNESIIDNSLQNIK